MLFGFITRARIMIYLYYQIFSGYIMPTIIIQLKHNRKLKQKLISNLNLTNLNVNETWQNNKKKLSNSTQVKSE